ncbi:MAG: protein kinase [Deltaproteobacteria bacterium]|nr:protein kinase [Deltaproteobacteria bacterium]
MFLFLEYNTVGFVRSLDADIQDHWIKAIAELSGMTPRKTRTTIEAAAGQYQLRNLFSTAPWDGPVQYIVLPALAKLSVTDVKECELENAVAQALGLAEPQVRARLRRAHGRTLLKNALDREFSRAYESNPSFLARIDEDDDSVSEPGGSGTVLRSFIAERGEATSSLATGIDAPQAKVGDSLNGGWVISKLLGEGGFGTVCEVTHRTTGTKAVAKLPRGDALVALEESVTRLKQEAEHLSQVAIEGVVKTRGNFEDPRFGWFLLLEHAGVSFAEQFRGHQLRPEHALALIIKCATIVDALHHSNKVHGDISPHNFCVDTNWNVTLIDLGIAMNLNAAEHREGTRVGTSAAHGGHRVYSAPEVLRGGLVTTKTDIYSLALVFAALLTGEYDKHERLFEATSGPFGGALGRALDINSRNRFYSCSEFIAALRFSSF